MTSARGAAVTWIKDSNFSGPVKKLPIGGRFLDFARGKSWQRARLQEAQLREAGASFRNEVVEGRGGRQTLLEDPAGNPIELFEPARD